MATDEQKAKQFITLKRFDGITVTAKQLAEIQKVFAYFRVHGESTIRKQATFKIIPKMCEYGVDSHFVQRLLRKHKYCKRGVTLYSLTLLYGRAGVEMYEAYKTKQSITNTFEYKQAKYGWTEEQFRQYNASRSVTLDNMIARHGEEVGTRKFEEYCARQSYAGCSLEYFIETHGEAEGTKIYEDLCRKKSNTVDSIRTRYNCTLEEAIEIRAEYSIRGSVSNNSQELCNSIFEKLHEDDKQSCHYDELNKEYGKYDHETKRYYLYDFVLSSKKVVVEYNGDFYHANPSKYSESDVVYAGKTAKSIWEYDKRKLDLIESMGFTTIVIWESEYLADKQGTIDRILKSIYND